MTAILQASLAIAFQRQVLPVLVLLVFLLPGQPLAAASSRIDSPLQQQLAKALPGEEIPVIVRMLDPIDVQTLAVPGWAKGVARTVARRELVQTLQARAEVSRQPLVALLKRHDILHSRQLWLINGMAFGATAELIEEISGMPEVASIMLDQVIEAPKVEPAQVTGTAEPNINLVNAPDVWAQGYAGQGVTVAIVDSGVDGMHPDLGPRWRGGSNSWFNAVAANCSNVLVACVTPCDTSTSDPCDYVDAAGVAHGTGVAGLIVGGDAGGSVIGVAPEAQWIAVKIFDSADNAALSVIHQGFQWLLDPDGNPATEDAPDIVNNSWGFESSPDDCGSSARVFQPDVQALKAAGIAVVFSAGNTGPDQPSSVAPANYPESFAVGSVGSFGSATEISSFSARGPAKCDGTIYPEVVAPGSAPHPAFGIKTSDYSYGGTVLDPYLYLSGTSFSASHVSGVMALLLSAFPEAPTSAVETALLQSATDLGVANPDNTYGYGLVDALAAFDYLEGQQRISVTDSISPETDLLLNFSSVELNQTVSATVTVRNVGSLPVQLGAVDDSKVALPFLIGSDACSDAVLSAGATCSISVQFMPTVVGDYSGSLDILADLVGQERVTVLLSGTGQQGGEKAITVTDSISPVDDGLVAFAQVVPDHSSAASIWVRNSSRVSLTLGLIDAGRLSAPFSIVSDGCSNRTLLVNQGCTIDVGFAPTAVGDFAGSLDILSDATGQPRVTVALTGIGNTPPVAPQPVSPAHGATVGSSVTFQWQPASDTDGDAVSQFLVYSTHADFSAATTLPVDEVAAALLGGGLLVGLVRRRRKLCLALALSAMLLSMVACGGGGGGSSSQAPSAIQSVTVNNLVLGTTYYWKVRAEDSRGGESESPVRSFVVQ